MYSDDKILVKESLNGDKKAFEEIVEKYYKIIYRLAYRIIRNNDDAEEITQIVFVKAYENLGSYNPKFKFFSWLYRITVNESLNFSKRQNFTEKLNEKHSTSEKNPDVIYDQTERSEKIQDALMELDMIYRLPVVLKHFMDYSYKEISYLIDIPEKTVKSRLFEGRHLLKNILVKKGFSDDRQKIY
jgi:RNA polymerase sigma-70 factor, ECF subfamily